jgi:hypothetical protein
MMLKRENHHRLKVVQAAHFLKCPSEPHFEVLSRSGRNLPLTGKSEAIFGPLHSNLQSALA